MPRSTPSTPERRSQFLSGGNDLLGNLGDLGLGKALLSGLEDDLDGKAEPAALGPVAVEDASTGDRRLVGAADGTNQGVGRKPVGDQESEVPRHRLQRRRRKSRTGAATGARRWN